MFNLKHKPADEKSRVPRDIDKLIENIVGLLETYIKIIQLEVKSGISEGITAVIIITFFVAFLSFASLFFSFGLALWLNYFFDWHAHIGYLVIAAFYVVLLVIIYLVKGSIKKLVDKAITNLIKKQ